MNKTVTVNIGGMVFHIEELAYEKMKNYLEAIRGYFTSSDGRDEIIQDIESRMAEMFTERIGTTRQVVTEDDVDFVINKMGKPEQVAGEDENASQQSYSGQGSSSASGTKPYRRLYRDPDDKVIGGVCSGFSQYVGIDPLWIRLAFAVAFFVFGSGLFLYILLWIIIPKAQSPAEKLEMRGEPVNINNIRKTVEEDVADFRNRMSNSGGRTVRTGQSTIARFFEGLGQVILTIFRFFLKFLGFIVLFAIFMAIVALFIGALTVGGVVNWANLPVAVTDAFLSTDQRWLVVFSALLVLGIPAIMLLYRLIKILFNIKTESRYVNIAAGILWTLGIVLTIITIGSISKEYKYKESARIDVPIQQPKNDTLYLDVLNSQSYRDESYYDSNWEVDNEWSDYNFKDTMRIRVKLDIVRAEGNEFELLKISSARGSDRKTALNNARSIGIDIVQEDAVLKVGENFALPKNGKFRGQKIQLVLKVPVGKHVFLNMNTDNIIYDIKNVTNTWDHDMVGKTWTMTENGLECVGCNLEQENKNEHVKININGKNISIDDAKDTVNWKHKDVKIHIGKDGVIIDAKDK